MKQELSIYLYNKPTPLLVASHLRGSDNYDVWTIQIRALVGVNGCKVIDSQPRKGGSFDPTLWDCLSEFVMSTIVISAHQSVIHDAAGCKRTATVYWAALRNVYLATDVQGAQQLLTRFGGLTPPAATLEAFESFETFLKEYQAPSPPTSSSRWSTHCISSTASGLL